MEPNNNMQNDNMSEPRPVKVPGFANSGSASGGDASGGATPANGGNDVVFQDKPKKNHSMLYGMILLAILAAGGIGFGVWAMMDGNSRAQKKDEQISQLQSQLAEKSEVVVDDDTTVVDDTSVGEYKNPVIRSDNTEVSYYVNFQSSYILGQDATRRVSLSVVDGKVNSCNLSEQTAEGNWRVIGECSINGLDENIYKVIEFGEGQMNADNKIGFITESGKVAYLGLYDFASSNTADIKNYLNLDKNVIDALEVGVGNGVAGGYGSTVFVFSDGSYTKYDAEMTQ